MSDIFHPVAWLLWLAAAGSAALLTRNPLYTTILLVTTGLTYAVLRRIAPQPTQGWNLFLRAGLVLVVITIVFNALTAHFGRMVLWQLPASWPVIGGDITVEAILYGIATGMGLFVLLLIFATFNVGIDQARLLRMTPRSFYVIGVVTSIAVTFVPQMLVRLQNIRDVQRLRGHRPRGIRDLGPLFLPLLTTGMEGAIQLAESMEARGFNSTNTVAPARRLVWVRGGLTVALGLLLMGVFANTYWSGTQRWAPWAMTLGLGLLVWLFWAQGQHVKRSHYQRWVWRQRDTLLALVCGLVFLVVLGIRWAMPLALLYYPYPPYSPWPAFQPLLGAVLALLVIPALLVPRH